MAEPFLGEIRLMAFDAAPKGWAPCDGQVMAINENQELFDLIGTTYGGDGDQVFRLPDLAGRTPIHAGNGYELGQSGGEQQHTLSLDELPKHMHAVLGSSAADGGSATPSGNFLGGGNNVYHSPNGGGVGLQPDTVSVSGGGQAHPNLQPYLTVGFCIALQGIPPTED
jgi:microcystin-dependent protein